MIMRFGVVCPPHLSSDVRGRLSPTSILPHKWGRKTLQYARSVPTCGSVSFPRVAGEGRDGGQRAEEVVCPPPQSSEVRGRLPPTSVLPHKWGRKTLPYARSVTACGSYLPACGSVSAFFTVTMHIYGDSRDDDDAFDDVLNISIHANEGESAFYQPEDHRANQRTGNAADAAH